MIERFGETAQSGGAGGMGIGIYKGSIYAEINDRIVRYSLPAGSIVPSGSADTIVSGLPLGGDHPMHPFIVNAEGSMYVDVTSATNSCQLKNRTLKSPGVNPCTELETRGGIWRYDANKTNQTFSPAGVGHAFRTLEFVMVPLIEVNTTKSLGLRYRRNNRGPVRRRHPQG